MPTTYQRVNLPVLASVWRASGLRGPAPPVYVGPSHQGEIANQPWYSRRVNITPDVLRGIQGFGIQPRGQVWHGGRPGIPNLAALDSLLHEYAHVNQPSALSSRSAEAGASFYSQMHLANVLQALHGPRSLMYAARTMPRYYGPERAALQRQLGPSLYSFLSRGQFGR
jgi:hypothetical protein